MNNCAVQRTDKNRCQGENETTNVENCFKNLDLKNLGWGERKDNVGRDTEVGVNIVGLWIVTGQTSLINQGNLFKS